MIVASVVALALLALLFYAGLVERKWLRVRTLRLATGVTRCRIVHFSDLHYKGDRRYLARVVERIDALRPDFVCFTGDIVEDLEFLPEALELLGGIHAPMFGVPGNHDRRTGATARPEVTERFAASGGAWLSNREVEVFDGEIAIAGVAAEDLGVSRPRTREPSRMRGSSKTPRTAKTDTDSDTDSDADVVPRG